jgi:hypothetical protein
MLFAAGMGIGLMFYGVSEPLGHFGTAMGGISMGEDGVRTDWAPLGAAAGDQAGAIDLSMAATIFHWGFHPWGAYAIVGLSLAARHESLAEPPTGGLVLSRAMLLLPLAALSCWWIPYAPLAGGLALIPYAIWLGLALTLLRRPIPRLVSALLAGIPLVDLIAAVPLAHVTGVVANIMSMVRCAGALIIVAEFKAADYLAIAARGGLDLVSLNPQMK